MTIHPMAPLAERIRIATGGRGLPLRRSTAERWSWLPAPTRPRGPRPAPLRPDGGLPWPRIGASLDLSGPPIDWARRRLQALFEPTPSVKLALLSTSGLMKLARPLGMSLHKISLIVTGADDFRKRQRALDRDGYASCWGTKDGLVIEDDGFDRWQVNNLPDVLESSVFQPVKARDRYLAVRLPLGCDYNRFDRALTEALSSARIDLWAATPAGRAYAFGRGLRAEELQRLTAYDYGGIDRDVQRADEIIQIRIERETHILVMIVEEVLLALSGWNGTRCW